MSGITSGTWAERDAAVVWHGFTQMAAYVENSPLVIERAEGRELIDADGKRYLDAISSLWVTTLGHRVPELDAALVAQADRVAHSTMLGNGNTVVVELAEALAGVVPVEDPHFLFASDGAVAIEQALKIAFQYWVNRGVEGRTGFLTLGDAYHGDTIGALSLGDGGVFSAVFEPLCFPVIRTPGYADPGWAAKACAAIDAHATGLAAVVIEPLVQGASGMLCASASDVRRIGEACRQAGVLLICDEVATGFGRTGTLFASEQCGLRPDLLCLGKGITGGYLAMSATVASRRGLRRVPRHRPRAGDPLSRAFLRRQRLGGGGGARAPASRRIQGRTRQRAGARRPAGVPPRRTGRRPGGGARDPPTGLDGGYRAGPIRGGLALGASGVRWSVVEGRAVAPAR